MLMFQRIQPCLPLLHSCRKTLEEFTFMPCVDIDGESPFSCYLQILTLVPHNTHRLTSQMTALKVLTLYMSISEDVGPSAFRQGCLFCLLNKICIPSQRQRRSFLCEFPPGSRRGMRKSRILNGSDEDQDCYESILSP
jgi:hypothetical protein